MRGGTHRREQVPDYTRSEQVSSTPAAAFEYLANHNNLPKYVATMVMAHAAAGEKLRVAADVQGRHEEGEGWFRTDAAAGRIEWGSADNPNYTGSLVITGADSSCTVTIKISTDREGEKGEPEEIERALAETTNNIKRLLGSP